MPLGRAGVPMGRDSGLQTNALICMSIHPTHASGHFGLMSSFRMEASGRFPLCQSAFRTGPGHGAHGLAVLPAFPHPLLTLALMFWLPLRDARDLLLTKELLFGPAIKAHFLCIAFALLAAETGRELW
ncbi:hypothetical protein DL89DRAFT_116180 [Linderina pennispora]|uniref:Uncharacterized protein n=1 Tax=Linderina pennispora TaxID=61395 RepID=A0A1Y1VWN0_9FUNG|nr:uncharacterized protein DL89DRAFT_116180 [Linderina pennispora]ORX65396.1 hypothetical protein DL89DRAFT_116180 [Linderina pennispora]